jgi:hypothetical protein
MLANAMLVEAAMTKGSRPSCHGFWALTSRCTATSSARHPRRGSRIDKPKVRTHIDAIIALRMAVERAENPPEPVRLLGWL